jgi:hypothetical protein
VNTQLYPLDINDKFRLMLCGTLREVSLLVINVLKFI